MARPCSACHHPDKAGLNKVLVTTADTYQSVSDRFGLSVTSLKNHYKLHVEPQYGPRPDRIQAKRTEAAVVQLERAERASILDQADMVVHQAVEVQGAASTFAKRLLDVVDDEGNPVDPDIVLRAFKVWVEANGGGVLKALELKGRLSGELATGSQVNVQVNVALQGALQRVGEENGRWLTEDAPAAVRAGLAELGVTGPALERGTAAVVRHLVAGRAGLGARIAAVLDQEVGT